MQDLLGYLVPRSEGGKECACPNQKLSWFRLGQVDNTANNQERQETHQERNQ